MIEDISMLQPYTILFKKSIIRQHTSYKKVFSVYLTLIKKLMTSFRKKNIETINV